MSTLEQDYGTENSLAPQTWTNEEAENTQKIKSMQEKHPDRVV